MFGEASASIIKKTKKKLKKSSEWYQNLTEEKKHQDHGHDWYKNLSENEKKC